jgi:hypothetical protein
MCKKLAKEIPMPRPKKKLSGDKTVVAKPAAKKTTPKAKTAKPKTAAAKPVDQALKSTVSELNKAQKALTQKYSRVLKSELKAVEGQIAQLTKHKEFLLKELGVEAK